MRRAPIVIGATVLGTAGVLLFKPLPASTFESSSSSTTSSSSSDSSSSSSSAESSSATAPSTGTSSSAPSSGASASSSPSSSTSTAASVTETGAVESDRYGNTQVKVVIKSGKITEIDVLAYNDTDPRSAQISQAAIPTLRQEVLSKQTAAVDTVSGATYTSNAYEASLQSALDKAGYVAPDKSKANTDLASADANLQGH